MLYFSHLSHGKEKYFCFLFIASRALLQSHTECNGHLQRNFLTCYSCLYYSSMFPQYVLRSSLRKECPNTEFFLVRIFSYLDRIRRFTLEISRFSQNTGKYGPEKTPYSDIFREVDVLLLNPAEQNLEIFCKCNLQHFLMLFQNKHC